MEAIQKLLNDVLNIEFVQRRCAEDQSTSDGDAREAALPVGILYENTGVS